MPKASMYIWAKIPEAYAAMGSLEFAKKLLLEGQGVRVAGRSALANMATTMCALR
jgi:aspartate/methionine/tyrosine aminotransferase